MKISLASNVKKYRKKCCMTQQDLAFKAELPISVITKLEQGLASHTTIQTVVKIAQALEVSLDELVLK